MKKTLVIISAAALLFSFGACQKKEEKPEVKSQAPSGPIMDMTIPGHGSGGPSAPGQGQGGPSAPGQSQGGPAVPGHSVKKTEFNIVVPKEVKDSWTSAVFTIEDKKEAKQKEVTVKVGGEFEIAPGLVVKTGPFLPDFKMSAETITSTTNNPDNPAIGVEIYENGAKVFPATGKWGWLYVNFPTIHSFEHSRYSLVLKKGVKK